MFVIVILNFRRRQTFHRKPQRRCRIFNEKRNVAKIFGIDKTINFKLIAFDVGISDYTDFVPCVVACHTIFGPPFIPFAINTHEVHCLDALGGFFCINNYRFTCTTRSAIRRSADTSKCSGKIHCIRMLLSS